MNKIKETKIQTPNGAKQILENLTNNSLETISEALAEKDKTISELEYKIDSLKKQNNDLDYLLNSGRNKYENERIKELKELKEKLNKQTKLIIEGKEFKIYKYFRHWYVDKLSLIIFFDKERDK
jgi:DNA gyrase/topoisomerase IV subunit A